LGKVTLYQGIDATEITCPECKGSGYIEIPEAAKTISPKMIGKGANK
jgi:phage FluMu protein Com